ncbi:MAG: Glycosyltransferase AglD [Methanocella sp. PtaU1.Bin125]|nr:MAG: Glycosyltransferase AglD [Methanocella sp. PtaU1.Bin125]
MREKLSMKPADVPATDRYPDLSIVIPVFNEEENVGPLYEELSAVLRATGLDYEIVFVDDGSSDATYDRICEIVDEHIRIFRFRRHRGKADALALGFDGARGDVIITMDGDQQDDPAEIPRFIEALARYDVVSGWKQNRQDALGKRLSSRVFNWLTRQLTGVHIHDFNCGFKAYRQEVVKSIGIYGELHRYIPAIASWEGYSVGEIGVRHRPRTRGRSKYGFMRLLKGTLDLLTIKFLMSYGQRPLHLFGGGGLIFGSTGLIICTYMAYLWLNGIAIGERPLLMLGILLIIVGIQLFAIGLLGELIISTANRRNRQA